MNWHNEILKKEQDKLAPIFENQKTTKMRHTKIFIVLNEHTLNTMKGKGGKTAKFKTEEQANEHASKKLEIWRVVKVHFNHKWIQHEANEN